MPKIIDAATDVTRYIPGLKAAGIEAIIRYDCRSVSGDWKQLHVAEAHNIKNAGLQLGIVYEDAGATPSSFSEQTGYLSAIYARKMAAGRGQPDNSAIYFAVDFDPTRAQLASNILPYFQGVARGFREQSEYPVLRMGAYCSGMCADVLRARYPGILIWITCSLGFAGSTAAVRAGNFDIWQGTIDASGYHQGCDKTLARLGCDFDTLGPGRNYDSVGIFTPWAITPPPEPVPAPPPVIAHDARWLQTVLQQEGVYHGAIDGGIGPLSIAAMIAYVEKHQPEA